MQRLIFAAVLVALGCAGAASGQDARISISAPKVSVQVGQPISIEVQLKNTSEHEIDVGKTGGQDNAGIDYHVVLLGSGDHPVARTKYGAAVDTGKVEGSVALLQLKPGQTLTQHFDLTKLFKLTDPGTYSVRAGRKLPERAGKMVWSNILTITVAK